ncbi:MAG: DNA polymerase IV [Anaerolineae bacterium]|nr:DNA polymerase IV [Anaerolineae bacterium]
MDLDAFFASVEELLNPRLRGQAIIVGGAPEQRGVVASASYAARRFGVHSAMPMSQALRLCPHAVVVPARHGIYGAHSRRVMAILQEITPLVEQVSIDEAFLDVTGCERLWGPVDAIADLIRRRITGECQLPVSLGIASSKLVAKIACDLAKPQGVLIVPPGQEQDFLAPLPIGRLWGVGQVTTARLNALGIHTIGDLAAWPEEDLADRLGEWGHDLHRRALGLDASPVHTSREQRSISHEQTFAQDVGDVSLLQRTLLSMSERLAGRLREGGLVAQTVRLKLRFPDFHTVTRQSRLEQPTDQGPVIYDVAQQLLRAHLPAQRKVRLIGLGLTGLLEEGGYQLQLFDQSDQRRINLDRAVDEIRERFGREAIVRASLLRKSRHDSVEDEAQ